MPGVTRLRRTSIAVDLNSFSPKIQHVNIRPDKAYNDGS